MFRYATPPYKEGESTGQPVVSPVVGVEGWAVRGRKKNSTFCNVLSVSYLIVIGVVEVRRVELLTS